MAELEFSPLPAGMSFIQSTALVYARWMIRACINITNEAFASLKEGPRPSDGKK